LPSRVPVRWCGVSLNHLLAFSTLQRQPLTVELATAALATLAGDARVG